MKTIAYNIILFLFITISPVCAQIGINTETPDNSSILEITNSNIEYKGILIPHMTTEQKNNIPEPEHSLFVFDTNMNSISQNKGTKESPEWVRLTFFNRSFFYMPSINISTTEMGSTTKDLYAEYKKEYGTPMYKSPEAPDSIPYFTSSEDLYYYVTYFDPTRITIDSITSNGVMNYTVIKQANYDDYINIVFVVK